MTTFSTAGAGAVAGLHPELAQILGEYERIVDMVDAQTVSVAQAHELMALMQVADAAGAMWGLDEHGQFVRRITPDSPPVLCDPALFATPASLAAGNNAPPPPLLAPAAPIPPAPTPPAPMPAVPTPAMPTPPIVAPADEAGWNAVDDSGDATPGWENEMVAPAAPASGPAPWDPTASTSAPGWGSEPEPAREPAPRHLPAPVAWVGNWVRANKLTVVVAVVAVALVVVVFATRTPTEPDGSTPTTTLADLPTAPDVPSVEALNQLTTALTSGEAPTVQAVMVAPVGDNLGAMEAVRWFGIAKLGFVVAWEKPTTTGEGKATARGTVVDSANRPIADVTAELVKQPNGSWQVTKWPSFSAPGA